MGEVDTERQALNVARMRLLGAEVIAVTQRLAHPQGRDERGVPRLGDQRRHARTTSSARSAGRPRSRRWCATSPRSSATRPAAQCLERLGRLPDAVLACVGGGSNAMGIFAAFIPDEAGAAVRLRGRRRRRRHRPARGDADRAARPASCTARGPTCCRTRTARPSSRTRSRPAWTIPGVGPEHAWLKDTGRATYLPVTDAEAMDAFRAAVPDRGHHPGDRERACARRCARRRRASSARTRCCSSTSPGAATRTWTPRRTGSGWSTVTVRLRRGDRQGPRRRAALRWSATCRPAFRPTTGASRRSRALVDGGVDVDRGRPARTATR